MKKSQSLNCMMARIDPKPSDLKALFALSGNLCAFPECQNVLISKKGHFIGQLCHIEAANEKGPRYNKNQSEDDRRSFGNLILLCYEHHTEIDDDVDEFSVARLKEIKKAHEERFQHDTFEISEDVLNKAMKSIQIELSKLLAISQDTNQVAHNIEDKVTEILKRLPVQSSGEEERIYFDELLSTIKEIKKQGKYITAIDLLLDCNEKYWDKIDAERKYKLLANIGLTYLDLHQREKGAQYLQAIKDVHYETAESLSLLCLGYAIDEKYTEFDACFAKAITLDRKNVNLWVAYIERNKKEKTIDQILSELPNSITDSVPMLFSIGTRLIDESKKADGISFLKKAMEKHEDSPEKLSDTKAVIATHIMKDLVDPLKFVYKGYSEDELGQLEEAKALLTEAWNVIGDTELAKYKSYILLNRGVINKITGKKEPALSDFQKAYDLSHQFIAFKNLLFMYIQLDRLDAAEQLFLQPEFASPLNEEETFELKTFKARMIFLHKDPVQGIQLMNSLLDEKNDQRYIEIATHIVAMSIEQRKLELGLPIVESLLTRFPNLHTGYLYHGYISKLKREKDKALEYFDKANELITNETSINDIHILAGAYIDLKQYEKAIPLFERVTNKNILNDFSRGLIEAYFKLGDLQAAFVIANNLFKRYKDNIYLAEIISSIYQETKQYDKAIEVLERFLPSADDHVNDVFSYRCARLYSFKRDWDNTKKWALRVRQPGNFAMFDSFTLAWLFLQSGDPDSALDIALGARTKYFDDGDAHYNYFNILVAVQKDDATIFPEEVRDECAVQIKMETGEEKTFLITGKNIKGENILQPNDSFTLQLFGKKKGDTIVTDNGYGFNYTITVIGIMDIYTHAFRETLKLLETRFAGQHPIGIVHNANPGAPDDPMEQLIKTLTVEKNASEQKLFELYNQRKATIGMLATANRRNQVMQQFALISSQDVSVIAFSRNEHPAVDHAISNNTSIILDLTSLVTLFFLYKKQNLLSFLNNPLIVSQSTISELHACYEELQRSVNDGLFTMRYEDGKLVGHMTPKETIEDHRNILKRMIDWCNQHAQVMVSSKHLELKREQRNKYAGALGESFFDTMLLADEHQAAVLSDDDNFNNFLRSGKTPLPFSTYGIAHWLLGKGKLTQESFDEFRTALIHANYIFIPVTTDILWHCFDVSGFQLKQPFTVAVKGLLIMLPQHCAQQLAAFLKKLYLASILATTREQILLYIFRDVSSKSDYAVVKNFLIRSIDEEFKLLPHFRRDLLELLSAF